MLKRTIFKTGGQANVSGSGNRRAFPLPAFGTNRMSFLVPQGGTDMQRPMMSPTFFEESHDSSSAKRRPLRFLWLLFWKPIRLILRMLTYDPVSRIGFRAEEHTAFQRFIRAIMYRLAFVPVLLAAVACAVVWTSTHPRAVVTETDPSAQGIHYETVTFTGAGNVQIEGWLVPVLEAKAVLEHRESVLRKNYPAVVLVHDFGQRRGQLLPMVKPLHEAGFVVMAINLRGGGNRAVAGETFGLNESVDVKAAVDALRRRTFVDSSRIALVGCGTGATAALLAGRDDPQIAAIVADRPLQSTEELLLQRIVPKRLGMKWIAPLCKWTFELAYKVDVDDVSFDNLAKVFKSRPVLLLDPKDPYADPTEPKTVEQVKTYLVSVLGPKDPVARAK
jgi:pimeloyl-ACP methyl ester carboxylesterase